ncbi:MAG TPA: SSI family serine proteinase inhibitor [Gaiellaceae bacterium]|nr:SSI family serine proteinase inhibitor [Gaiellaceae bacterium]
MPSRLAVALVVAVAFLVGCGSASSAGTAANTSLTITYWPTGPSGAAKKTWRLRCNPAGGTLARPAVACRRLAAGGPKLFAAVPKNVMCAQVYGGPQTARVVGTLDGKRISARFGRSDGCELERWNRLSPWLLPRGGVI